jgi:hypothetical protein
MILWRAMDAKKNAVSMVAQHHFSHKDLQGADHIKMLNMLQDKCNVMFEYDYPKNFREGRFFQRRHLTLELDSLELASIPEQHRPTGPIVRTIVEKIDMPPFNTVKNRVEVIFEGAEPVT